ncbi:MAG: flagellar basal body P-ring formation chaperone FlgA [Tabrizicola sp.]|uniref:flagellar basal body P-ring formation chaperone FlgA n=1 Tax=Tabrizicola sp. TaxID=2005166 RepID=UPI002732D2AF|nr:flagellar basal body P-ring formation chaperone FlgA [Tabrizicola sp.]MDP3262484.1 flagellar basal body P-ring formation chaperone FlgA [Tabrizicola sp.]MDP3648496.1 flagellar basal body P-ring formation chaperone FlgA [Paracoccaceae bacterium]MDZ4066023.1 flagellar basal body P-ring formation chaperone FlgA [Tabrizicola sp.]
MRSLVLAILIAQPVAAESLVATRTIRAQSVIAPDDLTLVDAKVPDALTDPAQAVGQQARITIYAGRPLRLADLGPASVVDRNQVVPLVYLAGGLAITTEGRALARGAEGDVIRVINLGSRTTVSGRVGPDGTVYVGVEN